MTKEIRHLTCIVCPVGCQLRAEIENGEVVAVSGNLCKRGEEYAKTECVNPVRTLTTTVRVANAHPLPVRSEYPLPKSALFHCMELINQVTIPATKKVAVGDVIIENIAATGINIIATSRRGSF